MTDTSPRDAIIFDIDGTLLDASYHHAFAWVRSMREMDYDPPFWEVHRAIGIGGDQLVARVLGDEAEAKDGDMLRTLWEKEYARLQPEVRPLPGARELVESVNAAGHVVLVASSGEEDMVTWALDRIGITDLVDAYTTSGDAEKSKPEPDLILAVLEKARDKGIGVERAVMVGDAPYDVQAADGAGIGCVCVRAGGFGPEELGAAGALDVVDGPADLVGRDWSGDLKAV